MGVIDEVLVKKGCFGFSFRSFFSIVRKIVVENVVKCVKTAFLKISSFLHLARCSFEIHHYYDVCIITMNIIIIDVFNMIFPLLLSWP